MNSTADIVAKKIAEARRRSIRAGILAVLIVSTALAVGLTIWLALSEINESGLKSVVDYIWCGESGCQENATTETD